jgi:hypothetical protein
MTGFVYFLRCGDFVKIGFSKFPNIRINHLRTATPYQVELLGKLEGTQAHERALHRYFADVRHTKRHEWFRLTDGIMAVARNGYPDNLSVVVKEPSAPRSNKLADYLNETGISRHDFAKQIGVSSEAVRIWLVSETDRMPQRPILARIVEATNGRVTGLDFLPSELATPATPSEGKAA